MTRKSRREIENAVDDLAAERESDASDLAVVWEDPDTGEWYADADDEEPIDPATVEDADPLMILRETVVETTWTRDGDQ